MTDIELQHKLADLDRIYAQTHQLVVDATRITAQTQRLRQEIRYQPILAMISGMTAGAALFAAGAALMKIYGGV